jgi:hypothetical protein
VVENIGSTRTKKKKKKKPKTWVVIKEQNFSAHQIKEMWWNKSNRMNSEKGSTIKISQISEKHVKSYMETVTLGTCKFLLGQIRLILVILTGHRLYKGYLKLTFLMEIL